MVLRLATLDALTASITKSEVEDHHPLMGRVQVAGVGGQIVCCHDLPQQGPTGGEPHSRCTRLEDELPPRKLCWPTWTRPGDGYRNLALHLIRGVPESHKATSSIDSLTIARLLLLRTIIKFKRLQQSRKSLVVWSSSRLSPLPNLTTDRRARPARGSQRREHPVGGSESLGEVEVAVPAFDHFRVDEGLALHECLDRGAGVPGLRQLQGRPGAARHSHGDLRCSQEKQSLEIRRSVVMQLSLIHISEPTRPY